MYMIVASISVSFSHSESQKDRLNTPKRLAQMIEKTTSSPTQR